MLEREQVQRSAEGPEGTEAAAPAPSIPNVLRTLQNSAGNMAVTRMLASAPTLARDDKDAPAGGIAKPAHIDVVEPKAGDAADMDRAIREHFSNEDYKGAATVLNGFSQADIDTRVNGYSLSQRGYLIDGAAVLGGGADRVRKVCEAEIAISHEQWERAAAAMAGYPDPGTIEPRVRSITPYGVATVLMYAERGTTPVAAPARTVATARAGEVAAAVNAAIGASDWTGAAACLNALPDEQLIPLIAAPPRSPAELFEIDEKAKSLNLTRVHAPLTKEPTAGIILVEGLDRDLRRQIAAKDWPGVQTTLEHYHNDSERKDRLQWFHLEEVSALALHLRGGGTGPASSAIFPLVEARRVEKLGTEYTAAIGGGFWDRAIDLLNAYNDLDLIPKAKEIMTLKGAAGVSACQAAATVRWPDDNNRIRRVLAFVPLASAASTPAGAPTATSIPLGPAAGPGVAVPGGTVTTHHAAGPGGQMFGQDYEGTDAPKTGWLQFLSREAEKFDASGTSLGFETSVVTYAAGQTEPRKWGTPSAPYWTVDTLGSAAPFYGSAGPSGGGARNATPTHSAMLDQPAANGQVLNACFTPPAPAPAAPTADAGAPPAADAGAAAPTTARVVMRFKFVDYLVRDMDVLYRNETVVTYTATSPTAFTGPVNSGGAGGAANKIDNVHFQALTRSSAAGGRFPNWTYFPHG